jgi:hypothetical protein
VSGPACKTSLGRIGLPGLEEERISIEIASTLQGWVSTFRRADETIADDLSAAAPWIDPRAPGRLTARLKDAAPGLDRKVIKAALQDCFETIRSAEDGPAIVPVAVARAIGECVSVQIELSDRPTYIVTLKGGRDLAFSAKEIAAHRPITLNEAWLSVHPREPLNATREDFEEVIKYWLEIAEEVEPAGDVSPWESVAEELQIRIAPLPTASTKEGLVEAGLYQEEGGPLWISNRIIKETLKDAGRDVNDSGFSRYLQNTGALMCSSKSVRVRGLVGRAWGFRPDFKPDDVEIADLADLTGEEEDRP